MRKWFVLLALALGACSSTGSLVVVDVEATPAIPSIARVSGTVTALGMTRSIDFPQSPPISTPFNLKIQLPPSASGAISVHVVLTDASGSQRGSGDASGMIAPGSTSDVTITIGSAQPDLLAVDGPVDLPTTDLAIDMAATIDLSTTPDMTHVLQCARETSPGAANLWTVYGTSSSDVYAGGEAGTILHSTGNGVWTVQHGTGAHLTDTSGCAFSLCPNDVRGIWASGPTNVIAVGEKTFGIMQSNGSGVWTAQTAPSTVNYWLAVYGTDAAHVWACGSNGAVGGQSGTSWGLFSFTAGSPNEFFDAIWASGPLDLYIGSELNPSGDVYHSSGGNPALQTNLTDGISSMWGSASNDVYLVIPLIGVHHSTGNGSWFAQPTATTAANGGTLAAIAGSSNANVYAVGKNNGGLIIHYDGSAWSPLFTLPSNDMGTSILESVWVAPAGDAFAVGNNGTIVHCK